MNELYILLRILNILHWETKVITFHAIKIIFTCCKYFSSWWSIGDIQTVVDVLFLFNNFQTYTLQGTADGRSSILISSLNWVFKKRFYWNSSSKLEKSKLETWASKLNSWKLWASRIKFRVNTINLHVPLSGAVAGYHSDNNTLHFSFKCRSYYCYGNIHVLYPKIDTKMLTNDWAVFDTIKLLRHQSM